MKAPRAAWEGHTRAQRRTWDVYAVEQRAQGWEAWHDGIQLFMDRGPFPTADEAIIACEAHAVQMSMLRIEAMQADLEREQKRLAVLMGLPL